MGDDLKQKMVSALAWASVDRFGQQIVQFAIGLVLARLLSPADFGLIGMVMIFSALSFVLVESGFSQALIRKKDADTIDYNSVFYFNIVIAFLIYCILFFAIIPISRLFEQPDLILIGRVIFLAVPFNALYLVPFAQLVKAMDFKIMAKVNLIAMVISGATGIALAVMGYGVWALVAQQTLYHFFRMVLYYYYIRWNPSFIFSFQVIKGFWGFSINLLGTAVLNVLFNNLYVLLLSKFYPIKQVGYYTQANKLNETFNFTFQSILVGSSYSILAKIQEDNERFRRVFREISKKTALITIPVMTVLIAIATPLISVLLTDKWLPAVPLFQLLALAAVFNPLYSLNITALNAKGHSRTTFSIEIIKKILIVISVVLCFKMGIIAMLWGYAIACTVAFSLTAFAIKKHTSHYLSHQIKDLIPCVSYSIILASIAYGLSFYIGNMYILLASQILLVGVLYILVLRITEPELFKKSMDFIVGKVKGFK